MTKNKTGEGVAVEVTVGAEVPDSWKNVASSVERVEVGDELSVEVEGGFIRGKTPAEGFVVSSRTGVSIYVPSEMMDDGERRCSVRLCSNTSADCAFVGSTCMPCWSFASGETGGESSQAYRNAVSAAKARKR